MTVSADPAAAAHPLQSRVPDFFIVGHPKCGTTALYETLRRHPQIFMPRVKEPRLFASDLHRKSQVRSSHHGVNTFEEYLSLFRSAGPEQRVGEASALYLRSRVAAGNIAQVQPAARIIAILREPASFLQSFHLQCVQSRVETQRDFRKAIALEEVRREGKNIPRIAPQPEALLYSDHVRYVEQLNRYHAVFPPEQILVLVYDDFRRDNEATVRSVLQFLEVNDTSPIEVVEANPTVRVRFHHVHALIHALSLGGDSRWGAVRRSVRALTPDRLRSKALDEARRRVIYATPAPPDESLMLELRRRFKGEVVALSEYLERDLVSLWGYDSI
jgi:Sulfotransferase family